MAAVAALNVLAGLGSEVVVVIKGLPGMGEELLSRSRLLEYSQQLAKG